MDITFLGACETVTGSKYLLKTNDRQVLVDCGLFQGQKELRRRNWDPLPISPEEIDAVILTHAHIDHSGYIPLLVKNGFNGKIYCTLGTYDLCTILLPDSGHIHEEDAKAANEIGYTKHHPAKPLYTIQDAFNALEHFKPVKYNQLFEIFHSIQFKFFPAGHIIGSAFVLIEAQDRKIIFTGDLGRPNHPIMRKPALPPETDYLVCESTYGDREHDKSDPLAELETIINETVKNKGTVIIPAFAVGRSQDILHFIYQLKQAKRIADIPVFLDSPMAQNASDLLCRHNEDHRLGRQTCIDMCNMAFYTETAKQSMQIDQYGEPIIVISASGMLEGGRILYHLKRFIGEPNNTIILTGYQEQSTRGSQLASGSSTIKIHGETYPVRAKIHQMESLSAHADHNELLDWLKQFKRPPIKTFLTHGNEDAAVAFKHEIETELGWNCIIPGYLDNFELK